MTNLKIAIDFEALFLVQKAFLAYSRDMYGSSVRYHELGFRDHALSYRLPEKEFESRQDDFFRLYGNMIHVAPGAVEIVRILRRTNQDNIVIVTDYPERYIGAVQSCIAEYFPGWQPNIFCNKIQLVELTDDERLRNVDIFQFLDDHPKFAAEILDQEYISKAQICACLSIDAVIDTNPITAQDMALMGINASLVRRPWNLLSKPIRVQKAQNWNEIIVEMRVLARERK